MAEAIELALRSARMFTQEDVAKIGKKIASAKEKIIRAKREKCDLFGIEYEAHFEFCSTIQRLETTMTALKRKERLMSRYAELNFEPFKWRDEEGWPRFAIFALDSPDCEFRVGNYKWDSDELLNLGRDIKPHLPELLESCYEDVFKLLETRVRKTRKVARLTARFRGLIPRETRKAIKETKKHLDSIYILAEVSGWKIEVVEPIRDPLVIGLAENRLWIIASFDTTPLEEYTKREFSL